MHSSAVSGMMLTRLLSLGFAFGHLLPAAFLLLATLGLLEILKLYDGWIPRIASVVSATTQVTIPLLAVFLVVIFLLGVFLLEVSDKVYRLLEGYGAINPLRVLGRLSRRRYRRLKQQTQTPDEKKRARWTQRFASDFPAEEEWVLPTRFGNIIRAFETYPAVMYGLDAIPGWTRLLGVIPKEYLDFIDGSKARVDFWVNLTFGAWIVLTEYVALSLPFRTDFAHWNPWIPIAAAAAAAVCYIRALSAARDWGAWVKAAFDLYLPELQRTLGWEPLPDPAAERKRWFEFSQAALYHLSSIMPRAVPKDKEPKPAKNVRIWGFISSKDQ